MAPRPLLAVALVLAVTGTLRADDPKHDEAVRRAIKGGQYFLKAVVQQWARGPGGGVPAPGMDLFPGMGHGGGSAALVGLALIESGLPADDPVVAYLAKGVREASVSATATYTLSLFVMFLDRVGEKADQPLIQFMTLRLLSGQCADGSWSYECNALALDPVEQKTLYADLMRGAKMATPDAPPKPKGKKESRPRTDLDDTPKVPKKADPPAPKEEERPPGLHPALERYARAVKGMAPGSGAGFGLGGYVATGDHSNTQFATVALWCGRRHHVPVAGALAALDKHYRRSVEADGGWGYTTSAGASSPAMTCAGLMGLAMGFGSKDLKDGSDKSARVDAEAVSKDPVVQGALKYVGDFLAAAAGQRDPRDGTLYEANDLTRNLYFMWSLERVGMAFGLTTIGKVDWYDWGSRVLVRAQNRDGSWNGEGYAGAQPDNATAFALLFLSRANLAQDLATSMKGKVRDPGTARLRSPGDLSDMLGKAGKGSAGPKVEPGTTRPKGDPPGIPTEVRRLADALVAATGAQQEELLAQYRDSKGVDYTDALAAAIPRLTGDVQSRARDALAQRSVRFTTGTLTDMMRSTNRELRRAAALAAGAKGRDRLGEFSDSLVRLTADEDGLVVQAARASLKALTGQDFGPEPAAGTADRTAATAAWKEWLTRQPK